MSSCVCVVCVCVCLGEQGRLGETSYLVHVGQGFSNSAQHYDILGWITVFCGGCSVRCRMFRSVTALHLLDAVTPPVLTTKHNSRYC